jgi:hypothetical protein
MVEIKGAVINGSINAVKKRNGVQVYNDIISQLDEQTRQFYEKPISVTGWYLYDFLIKFLEAEIKLTATGDENELQRRSEELFEKQLKGIYKIFFELGSPEVVFDHFSTLIMAYFKGVLVKVKFDGPDKAIITYTGFEKQHRLVQPSLLGFLKKVLEISGVKDIHAKHLTLIEKGKGYLEFELTWKGK